MWSSFLVCLSGVSPALHIVRCSLSLLSSPRRMKKTERKKCEYLFPLEDVSEVFQPQTLQELVDGHVEQSCRDTVIRVESQLLDTFTSTTSMTPVQVKKKQKTARFRTQLACLDILSPSFLSDPDAPSAGPVAPPTLMSPRGVVRLSMLLAADRQDGDGEGEMTTPPAAPVLTTPALTWEWKRGDLV